MQVFIWPNTCGKGIHIVHPGFCWVDEQCLVGENCAFFPGVLLGKKNVNGKDGTNHQPKKSIILGNNVIVGTNSTVLGPVRIGDNVMIAANSVVTSDIPDNCLVAGIPAQIKKRYID